jgi:hypothetical protein
MKKMTSGMRWAACSLVAISTASYAPAMLAQPIALEGEASCFAKKVFKRDEVKLAIDPHTNALFLKTHCGWQFINVLSPQNAAAARAMASPIEVPPQVLAKAMQKLDKIRIAAVH